MYDYMINPDSFLISERLKQLYAHYGKRAVNNTISGNVYSNELEIHINNLLLTYGTIKVLNIQEMFLKVG